MKKEICINTRKHKLVVDVNYSIINKSKVSIDKRLFNNKCKECRNYNKKYSCPPFSPSFNDYIKERKLFVLMLSLDLKQLDGFGYSEFHKVRIGNAILKPKIEKIMRKIEEKTGTKFLSSGACRLCRTCEKNFNRPCKHPDKRRYSLESVGVDCNELTIKLFKRPLLWYGKGKAPNYTSVVCAIPLKDYDSSKILPYLRKAAEGI